MTEEPAFGMRREGGGIEPSQPGTASAIRVVLTEQHRRPAASPPWRI